MDMSPPIRMKQWNGVQVDYAFRVCVDRSDGNGMHVQRPVGQHDAFRIARAPAGVKQFGCVVVIQCKRIEWRGCILLQQGLIVQVGIGDVVERNERLTLGQLARKAGNSGAKSCSKKRTDGSA